MRAMLAIIIWFALLALAVYLGVLAPANRGLSIGLAAGQLLSGVAFVLWGFGYLGRGMDTAGEQLGGTGWRGIFKVLGLSSIITSLFAPLGW
jgi:hypothetical protein